MATVPYALRLARARALGYESLRQQTAIRKAYAAATGTPLPARSKAPSPGNIKRVLEGHKPRDYAKEAAKRNARAQAHGFANRYQATQGLRQTSDKRGYSAKLAAECQQWSDKGGITPRGRYRPEDRRDGVTVAEYTIRYYDAWIGPGGYDDEPRGESQANRYWFTDMVPEDESVSGEEYDGWY